MSVFFLKNKSFYTLIFTMKKLGLIGLLGLASACGKHEIENYGYTRQVNAASEEQATTWQDRFEQIVNQNKTEDFNLLLNEEADYNALLKNGRTPLIHAVISGTPMFVYLLLQKNVDPTLLDDQGKTAEDYAIELQKDRVALMLNPDKQKDFQIQLFNSILNDGDNVSIEVKNYLEAGTNPNFIDEQTGETPLTQAIKVKSIAVTSIIRWTDPDFGLTPTNINMPNAQNEKPLAVALKINFKKAAKALQDLAAEEN